MSADPQRTEEAAAHLLPLRGDWPCQTTPSRDLPPKLVAFLYRLVRDGATAPSDVENHAIQAGRHGNVDPEYTNCHLELYARSLATYLLPDEPEPGEEAVTP